ncbi:MAG: GGDEF domain-containing protein [Exiguobacterium indicum]
MWNTLNHLILNVALTFFFVLISLFFFKRFQFRNTFDSWLKKNLLVLILATGAGYWVIHNAITYEGFRFDLSITLIVIAFIYGGISSGFITTLVFASLQTFFFDSVHAYWLIGTYLIVSIVVVYLQNEAPDRFISFPIIFAIALILCLPYVQHVQPNDVTAMTIFLVGNGCAGLLLHSILHQIRWHFNQVRMHRRLALTDTLTGLDNRRRLEETVQRYKSQQTDFSIMIIDVDHFKQVNDTYGHDRGDHILRQISSLLASYCPPTCVLGRFGGEEFMMLLPEHSLPETRRLAEQICEASAKRTYELSATEPLQVTLSIGVSRQTHQSSETHNFLQTIQQADAALYQAKKSGRNCVFHHDPLR